MGGERVETTGQEQEDPAIGMARACAAGLDSCKNTRLPPAAKSGETKRATATRGTRQNSRGRTPTCQTECSAFRVCRRYQDG